MTHYLFNSNAVLKDIPTVTECIRSYATFLNLLTLPSIRMQALKLHTIKLHINR